MASAQPRYRRRGRGLRVQQRRW